MTGAPGEQKHDGVNPAQAVPQHTLAWGKAYLRGAFEEIPTIQAQYKLKPTDPLEPVLPVVLSDQDKTRISVHVSGFMETFGQRPGSPLERLASKNTAGEIELRQQGYATILSFLTASIGSFAAITAIRSRNQTWAEKKEIDPPLLRLPEEIQYRLVSTVGWLAVDYLAFSVQQHAGFLIKDKDSLPFPSLSIFRGRVAWLAEAINMCSTKAQKEALIDLFKKDGGVFRDPNKAVEAVTQQARKHASPQDEAKARAVRARREKREAAFDQELAEQRADPELHTEAALELSLGQTLMLHEGPLSQEAIIRLIGKYTRLMGNRLYLNLDPANQRTPVLMNRSAKPRDRLFPMPLNGRLSSLCLTLLAVDEGTLTQELSWHPSRMPLDQMHRLLFSFKTTYHGGSREMSARHSYVYLDHKTYEEAPHTYIRQHLPYHGQTLQKELAATAYPYRGAVRGAIIVP